MTCLGQVLSAEFGAQPRVYWERAISNGLVTVNGKSAEKSYRLCNGDHVRHLAHRHEPCVFGEVALVGETSDLFAVCKPASMPMHPCGSYHHNTLSRVLEEEPLSPSQPTRLYFVHRLDRVTSGLVIAAKSKRVAGELSRQIRQNETRKTYLARVRGRFPGSTAHLRELRPEQLGPIPRDGEEEGEVGSKRPADESGHQGGSHDGPEGAVEWHRHEDVGFGWRGEELVLRVPLRVVSHREGVHECHPSGRPSLSGFVSTGYCEHSDTSLVECRLYTGRTHQLRLHLQLLGSPVANDPCYGGELFFGQPDRRRTAEGVWASMRASGLTPLCKAPHLGPPVTDEQAPSTLISTSAELPTRAEDESVEEFVRRCCRHCEHRSVAEQGKYCTLLSCRQCLTKLEHLLHCDGIWLHALRYEGEGWALTAPRPDWSHSLPCGCWSEAPSES